MVVVLDYLFCLPVTLGAGGALEGSVAWGRLHHPLESPAVVGGAVAVPGGDTAQQDALNCASVKVCEGFRCQATFLQDLPLCHSVCVGGTFQFVSDVYAEEAFHLLHSAVLSMWIGGCSLCCFPKSMLNSFILLMLSEKVFS